MSNNQRFIIGCILISIGIFIIAVSVSFLFTGCTGLEVQEKTYVLTSDEKQIVDFAYDYRHVWETRNGKSASNIRYKEKNGYCFLLVTYSQGGEKVWDEYVGESSPIGSEIKYTLNISDKKIYEATLDEYGSKDMGAVYGFVRYDTSANETEKKEFIAKAVTGQSGEITFNDPT